MARNWSSDSNEVVLDNGTKSKSSSDSNLFGKICLILGVICIVCGIVFFCRDFFTRYTCVGSPMNVEVSVTDVHEQIDTEIYTNAEAQVTKYHLSGTYDLAGKSQDIVLNESYYSEQEAKDCVNSIRKIAIDSIELTELVEKPINYLMCGIPVCVGLVLIIIYMISIIVRKKK